MDQNRMKQQANQGHSEHQFAKKEQVFLQLQPYKKTSLKVLIQFSDFRNWHPNFMVLI
jgi:hypothetical protein